MLIWLDIIGVILMIGAIFIGVLIFDKIKENENGENEDKLESR